MKVMITGGHGFLGKHVTKAFEKLGYTIYDGYSGGLPYYKNTENFVWRPSRIDLDLNTSMRVHFWHEFHMFDSILHMAALCGGILANKNSPADFLAKNIDMSTYIFQLANQCHVEHMYTLGSVCAYPKFCPVPFKEDDIWNGYPEETNAPYGIAKRVQMMLQQTYREQYGLKGAHLIPVNLYGEHDHFDPTNSHVIPALIRKFEDANRMGLGSVKLWGTGQATREFLYAGDAAEAIAKAVHTGFDSPLPINLGTGQDISIEDLAYIIKRLTGSHAYIQFTGEVSDGQPKRMLDVSRAKQLLGWTANTSFETGLKRTIDWYRSTVAS